MITNSNCLHFFSRHILFFFLITGTCTCFFSCSSDGPVAEETVVDSLTEEQLHLPENALKGLVTAEGVEVKAMATEPMLKNPTNIDVDERGRVWVTEAYNYR